MGPNYKPDGTGMLNTLEFTVVEIQLIISQMAESKDTKAAAKKETSPAKAKPAAKKTTTAAKKEPSVAKAKPAAKETTTTAKKEATVVKAKPAAVKKEAVVEPVSSTPEVVEVVKVESNTEEVVPVEEFDWDTFESDVDTYSKEERKKLNDIYDVTLTQIEEKELIKGYVISINKKEVVININYKSEGIVPKNEFRYNPDLKIGDEVDLYIDSMEDKTGQLVVSHKIARTHRAWQRVNEILVSGEIITGFV